MADLLAQVYSASKQVSAALNPAHDGGRALQECVLVRHPRHGEYAIAFVTGRTILKTRAGEVPLLAVYVPTNHVYIGACASDARTLIFSCNGRWPCSCRSDAAGGVHAVMCDADLRASLSAQVISPC